MKLYYNSNYSSAGRKLSAISIKDFDILLVLLLNSGGSLIALSVQVNYLTVPKLVNWAKLHNIQTLN